MDVILTDIVFALARAAVATLLSTELYSFTVPGLLLFSLSVYAVITRDPLRNSLPPYMDFAGAWDVCTGQGRSGRDKRELVRLSVFWRDVFWVSIENVMEGLVGSGELTPVYYGKGMVISMGGKEQKAIEAVNQKDDVELMKVFTSSNLARFNDVLGEELGFFIGKVSKAQGIVRGVIQEFTSRALQRIVYGIVQVILMPLMSGMGPKEKFNRETLRPGSNFREVLLHHYFPLLDKLGHNKEEDVTTKKSTPNVLCLESQLQRLDIEDPSILAYFPCTRFS